MISLFCKMWDDDAGTMLSVEYMLLMSVVVFGVSAGAVEVRGRVNAGLSKMGDNVSALIPAIDARTIHLQPLVAKPLTTEPTIPTVLQFAPAP